MSNTRTQRTDAAEPRVGGDAQAPISVGKLPSRADLAYLDAMCSSCSRRRVVLIAIPSPRGEYSLCTSCLGHDLDRRVPRAPTALPDPRPWIGPVPAAAAIAVPVVAAQTVLSGPADERSWDQLRESVARRDADRAARRGGR